MNFLRERKREAEWMDAADVDSVELNHALVFIRRINALLGYSRATVGHLDRLTRDWPADKCLKILDVATGSGDIPQAILRWADKKKLTLQIVALDLHQATIKTAAQWVTDPRVKFVRGDATALPFEIESFDFVLTGMFLHHLDETTAIAVLKEMDRVAQTGLIAADLLRSKRAYAWITLFTLLAGPMVRHDARVSVAGAFNIEEFLKVRDLAGLAYMKPYRHFGHRLVLVGRKMIGN